MKCIPVTGLASPPERRTRPLKSVLNTVIGTTPIIRQHFAITVPFLTSSLMTMQHHPHNVISALTWQYRAGDRFVAGHRVGLRKDERIKTTEVYKVVNILVSSGLKI